MTSPGASATRPRPVPDARTPAALQGWLRLSAHVALTNTATLFLEQQGNVWPIASHGTANDGVRAAALLLPDFLNELEPEAVFPDASLENDVTNLLATLLADEPGLLIAFRFPVLAQDTQAVLLLAHPAPRPLVSDETSLLLRELSRQIALRMEAREEKQELDASRDLQATLRQHVNLLADPRCVGHCIVNEAGHVLALSEALRLHLHLPREAEALSFEHLFAFDSTFQDAPEVDVLTGLPWAKVHDTDCVHRGGDGGLLRFRAYSAPVTYAGDERAWSVAFLRMGAEDGIGPMNGRQTQTILIAEDHPVNQRVIQGMVEKLGLRAEIVSNGLEAVHAVCHRPYAAILMDCQMPEMDGIEATRFIRANEESIGRIPIVAVTAFGHEDDRRRCLEAGVDEFMVKPIRMETLADVLRRWTKPDQPAESTAGSSASPASRRMDEALDRLRADLDTDVVRDIVNLFVEDSATRIGGLRAMADSQRWQDARDLVHKIKGSSSSLGARDLVDACEAFENERSSAPETLRQRLLEIEEQFAQTVPYLKQYIARLEQ
ncbi:MAG: response regulator [Bryobacterales bacterium]|nr:response regulator [Bryobacterales bacterium]